jgi:hypothetical protein
VYINLKDDQMKEEKSGETCQESISVFRELLTKGAGSPAEGEGRQVKESGSLSEILRLDMKKCISRKTPSQAGREGV